MTWTICGVALLVYVIGSYVVVYKMMKGSPAGLGMLFVPFAPILPPLMLGMGIWAGCKKLYQAIKR